MTVKKFEMRAMYQGGYDREIDKMFIDWVIDKGFESELLKEDYSNALYKFRER